MKILITGANGLLGQKLVSLIGSKSEHELIATSRGASRLVNLADKDTYASMDITSRDEVEHTIETFRPEVIIHTAAMTQVDDCEKEKEACWLQNVTAVEILVGAAKKHNCRLVHVSTDFIFDGEDGPYDEEAKPNPVSYYGESKLAAEKVVMNSGLEWSIARTVLVYGITPNMSRSNIILWVKKSLEEGKSLKIVDDQWRSPTLAEDLAMGCLLMAEKKASGVYNISGPDFLTPYDMAMKTVDYFQLDGALITKADSSTFTQPAKRPPRTGFILDKARTDLNYNPRSFEEGIAILADQIKA